MWWITAVVFGAAILAGAYLLLLPKIRETGLDQWVPTYIATRSSRRMEPIEAWTEPMDVFIAVCDHYEPEWGQPSKQEALERVKRWVTEYPRLMAPFQDVDGRPPRHTCFFPQDQYQPEYLDRLGELVRAGFADVDVHLHHDDDTPDGLREKLESFRESLFHRHGLLRRDPQTGQIVWGFIHGNWALCNSRRDGRWCGVDQELPVLLETGCYADFTFPSAPSDTQPQTINSIYYAQDLPGKRKSHNFGIQARAGLRPPEQSLLMIQGPLLFDPGRRKFGVIPKIENGDLLGNHPPTLDRLRLWLKANITLPGRPRWRFVKLHTHGCNGRNMNMLLGDPYVRFHQGLQQLAKEHPNFRYHYVTAWEMANIVHYAERTKTASASEVLDFSRMG